MYLFESRKPESLNRSNLDESSLSTNTKMIIGEDWHEKCVYSVVWFRRFFIVLKGNFLIHLNSNLNKKQFDIRF